MAVSQRWAVGGAEGIRADCSVPDAGAGPASADADALPPLGVELLRPDVDGAQRLVHRVTAAEHLQKDAEVRADVLDEQLRRDRALRVGVQRLAAVEVFEAVGKILE